MVDLHCFFVDVERLHKTCMPIVKRRSDSNVATGMKYGVASPSSWSNSLYDFETCITRIKEILNPIVSVQR